MKLVGKLDPLGLMFATNDTLLPSYMYNSVLPELPLLAEKYSSDWYTVKPMGLLSPPPELMLDSREAELLVVSFHSSTPLEPSSAWKYMAPLYTVMPAGSCSVPALMELTLFEVSM